MKFEKHCNIAKNSAMPNLVWWLKIIIVAQEQPQLKASQPAGYTASLSYSKQTTTTFGLMG